MSSRDLDLAADRAARYLVVGAHALAFHGVPRASGDLDLWIEATSANAKLVYSALEELGARIHALQVRVAEGTRPEVRFAK